MHPTPRKFLMPGWFSMVMGLAGLALAWHSAEAALGSAATGVSLVFGVVAVLVFVALLGLSVLRFNRFPAALAEDLRHPVRHAFVAALPVATLLLVTLGVALAGTHPVLDALWWLAALGQLWATVWVLKRWLVATPVPPADSRAFSTMPQIRKVSPTRIIKLRAKGKLHAKGTMRPKANNTAPTIIFFIQAVPK